MITKLLYDKRKLNFIHNRLTKQGHFDLCRSSRTAQPASGGAGTSVVGKEDLPLH